MLAYTFVEQGRFELREKPRPELQAGRDAIVRVTLGSICTSDLHIKHGSVPRAVPGITVGHEMVGLLARSHLYGIVGALGATENILHMQGNGYYVTWAFGHLV